MTLIDALKAFNKNQKDKTAKENLRQIVGNRAVFQPNARPNAADIDKALEFLENLGQDRAPGGKYKDYQTLEEYLSAGKKALEADPSVDGVALDPDGVSMDAVEVDWSKVSRDRRLLVLHGRDIGKLTRTPSPDERYRWAADLSNPPNVTLPAQWKRISESLGKLKGSEREVLDGRLDFQRPAGVPTPRPFAEAVKPAVLPPAAPVTPIASAPHEPCAADIRGYSCPGLRGPCGGAGERGRCGRTILGDLGSRSGPSISVGGSVSGSTIVVGNGNTVGNAGSRAPVKVFILFTSADARFVTAMRKACGGSVREGLLTFADLSEVRPGSSTNDWISQNLRSSDVVIFLCSADSLADDGLMNWLSYARGAGKYIIPIMVRPTYVGSMLGDAGMLLDKPISGYSDADTAWMEVSNKLRVAIQSMK